MIINVNMTRLSIRNNLVSLFKLLNFQLLKIFINIRLTFFEKLKTFFFDIRLKFKI